jgi:hypothetical protein
VVVASVSELLGRAAFSSGLESLRVALSAALSDLSAALSAAVLVPRVVEVALGSVEAGVVVLLVVSGLSVAVEVPAAAFRPDAFIFARSAAVLVAFTSVAGVVVVLVADASRFVVVARSAAVPVTLVLVALRSTEVPLTVVLVLVRVISAGSSPKCV